VQFIVHADQRGLHALSRHNGLAGQAWPGVVVKCCEVPLSDRSNTFCQRALYVRDIARHQKK
jgi:hypothetical protein